MELFLCVDVEFVEDFVQVVFDGARVDEQLRGDLWIALFFVG